MHAIKQAFSFIMQIAEMDCNHPASVDPLITEYDSEAFCSFTGRQSKKNPLKSKRVNVCHKDPELEHEGTPGKRRRTEKEVNIPNTVNTNCNSEASCSFTGRQSKENFLKSKRRNVCHEGPELEHEEAPASSSRTETEESIKNPVKTEYNSEASCSFAGRQSKENPLKTKRVNVCHKEPELELEDTSGNICRMEIRENIMKKLNVRRISLYRTAKLCARYIVNELLGEGGSGVVYSGVRKTDGKKVAIKFACKTEDSEYISLPGDTRKIPVEVALMELVSKPPRSSHIIELLEWFDAPNFFILILEWPEPCIDLFKFCKNTTMSDSVAQLIIHQIAVAASHCLNRGVFHRDIKEENILINPDTFDVKLIDFGFGDLLKEFYIDYSGTAVFAPPEVHNGDCYQAESATIWGLGILLYSLLCGYVPYKNMLEIRKGNLYLPDYLSEGSCRLITWCLEPNPDNRPTVQQFLRHDWL